MALSVHALDPLSDARWGELVARHAKAGIFHTTGWLESLRRTYGYDPVVYTTSPPGERLRNGLLFCRVESWLTGHRLVSVPFTDHCEPLVDCMADMQVLLASLEEQFRKEKWLYIEMRPLHQFEAATTLYRSTFDYRFHQIDLEPSIDTLFRNCHKDSVQRKIRRAEREKLTYQDGRSEALLQHFYRLLSLTRRRHQVPPHPLRWFRNLIDCVGEALHIRVAFKSSRPVAAVLTLCHRDTLVYKYGCSDAQFNPLGGMHLLLWTCIQEAKNKGLGRFDLGRSDCGHAGLITFKDRWGAAQSTLTYSRYAPSAHSRGNFRESSRDWRLGLAKHVFAYAPSSFLSAAGNFLYKHIG
ncbi:MAG TPA: GNAT family N-acetyltransferase [Pyrinomonadaceae bacterium]|nr:GNAT family N-acetyltransferase [Pyrinomonadaceae bacterium]